MSNWTIALIDLEVTKVSATIALGERGIIVIPEITLAGVPMEVRAGAVGAGVLEFEIQTPSVQGCFASLRASLDVESASLQLRARADYPGSYLEVEDGLLIGHALLGALTENSEAPMPRHPAGRELARSARGGGEAPTAPSAEGGRAEPPSC